MWAKRAHLWRVCRRKCSKRTLVVFIGRISIYYLICAPLRPEWLAHNKLTSSQNKKDDQKVRFNSDCHLGYYIRKWGARCVTSIVLHGFTWRHLTPMTISRMMKQSIYSVKHLGPPFGPWPVLEIERERRLGWVVSRAFWCQLAMTLNNSIVRLDYVCNSNVAGNLGRSERMNGRLSLLRLVLKRAAKRR